MKSKIVCTYQGLGVERVVDDYLIDNMCKMGAKFIGSGYNMKIKERDLQFEISIGPVVDKKDAV